jgi:hypothetical protein
MGARPDQQLALSFLSTLTTLWLRHPGKYRVEETDADLVPALAQMCIKALAADVRDGVEVSRQRRPVTGELIYPDDRRSMLTIRDVVNKIIHGGPERVEVTTNDVLLYFVNNDQGPGGWSEMWFSARTLSKEMDALLYKHDDRAAERERRIAELLDDLGEDRFLPSPA